MCTRRNLLATAHVGQRHHHLAIEATRTQQRRIEHVGAIGRRDDDDAFVAFEAVHLDQQLVESLLAFVMTAAQARATMTADRVDFVDEDDAGRVFLGLLEHVTHTRCADAANISTKSEPEIVKNGTLASPAMARASSVLPVPGEPTISTPFGILPPNFWNLDGSLRSRRSRPPPAWLRRRPRHPRT